jgi:hypothetical protein
MKQVRVFQEVLASDGINPSKTWPAGSIADLNDAKADYVIGMSDGVLVSPPINSVAPACQATIVNGSTITCNNGTWLGDAPITYTYQWYDGANPVVGRTAATYATVVGDVGKVLHCRVTATNAIGTAWHDSNNCTVT